MRLALFILAVALSVPTAARAQVDHLKCYKIKDHLAKVPPYTATLTPGNPSFTAETGCVVKVPAKMLCIDVTKSNVTPNPPGAAPGPQAGTFLCYKLKCQGATPSLSLTDQFGTRQVDVGAAKLLCAPVTGPPPTTTTTTTQPPVCGNGVIDPGETCDDGNTSPGDGCDVTCHVEAGWQCTGQPSTCQTICGDGITAGSEQCDDGNTVAGDGCSATCHFEVCGNGMIDAALGETCDDGNTSPGDGCAADCHVEGGWQCTGQPSTCQTICGDGIIAGSEQCDDGNTVSGDGCSAMCQLECGQLGQACSVNGDCCSNNCSANHCAP